MLNTSTPQKTESSIYESTGGKVDLVIRSAKLEKEFSLEAGLDQKLSDIAKFMISLKLDN